MAIVDPRPGDAGLEGRRVPLDVRIASREDWRDYSPASLGKSIAERTPETIPHQNYAPALAGDLYGGFWQKQ